MEPIYNAKSITQMQADMAKLEETLADIATTIAPPTKTVRVVDRSTWGTSAPYPLIRDVTVEWICPACGGPRGEPQVFSFMEDGEALVAHRWWNDCGHVDYYSDVLIEEEMRLSARRTGDMEGA